MGTNKRTEMSTNEQQQVQMRASDTTLGAVWDGSDVQKASNDQRKWIANKMKQAVYLWKGPNTTKQPQNPLSCYHTSEHKQGPTRANQHNPSFTTWRFMQRPPHMATLLHLPPQNTMGTMPPTLQQLPCVTTITSQMAGLQSV